MDKTPLQRLDEQLKQAVRPKTGTMTDSLSNKLVKWGVYREYAVGNKWCFKYQPKGIDIIIVLDPSEEKAASMFLIEFLKGIHYSLKRLLENGWLLELQAEIEKYESFGDENVTKTVDIFKRQFIKP